jgi:hypothetical protein
MPVASVEESHAFELGIVPAQVNDPVRLLRMFEYRPGPAPGSAVRVLGGNSIVTGELTQAGSRQVHSANRLARYFSEGPSR